MTEQVVVVVSGGEPPSSRAAQLVPAGARVIAADGGLEHARLLGLRVGVAVGDFDSASPESVAAAEATGTRVQRHPREKDATDLELALDEALDMGAERIVVLAGSGGRLDHELATLLLLSAERYTGVTIDALIGDARVHVVRGERLLEGVPGELVSLLPVHGPAIGVRTEGLAYPLRGETLTAGSTRGVSNVFASERAHVSLESGVLLAIRPGDAA